MVGTRLENEQHLNSLSGNTLGTERLQEKARMTEEELGRCHQNSNETSRIWTWPGRRRSTSERN